eukprot:CAMPEP_0197666026 /NCGR_PEP_ID=MMETSP1338-20131121/61281_1 /TAXON_ID=43686 ORGANISM="Pelagodinium beii, Strain RCC1491" /NCGR_SAMPLE_ID=MMETSP1338 /ASSEMBLY_ACC=CAM_ASM_000754 /LENGTH=62 /DNA_ID=CAMNT_0043244983 /DNA_START=376 /DNA_END=560 /DNA_ORIENTATION=-
MKRSMPIDREPLKSWIRPCESAMPIWPTQGQQQVSGPSGPQTMLKGYRCRLWSISICCCCGG